MAKDNTQDRLFNLQAQQLAAQVANWAATLDFQKERFRLLEMPQFQQGMQLEVDKLAWQKAQDTWERAFQEASITGMYNGQPTTQWLMDQARLTGSYNGERTLEGKLTDAQIQDMHDKMALANNQFLAATTGYFNGQKTFDRDKFEAAQALEGWKFISSLSGPQNAFKQARAIASTPGGLDQIMSAFAGSYMLPGSSSVGSGGAGGANPAGQLQDMVTGIGAGPSGAYPGAGGTGVGGPQPGIGAPGSPLPVSPTAVAPPPPPGTTPYSGGAPGYDPNTPPDPSDPNFSIKWGMWVASHPGVGARGDGGTSPYPYGVNPATGEPYTSYAAYPPQPGYTYSPPGAQAPPQAYNYSGTNNGSVAVYPPGVASPPQTADVSSYQPLAPTEVAAAVAPNMYQYGGAPNAAGLSAPVAGNVNPSGLSIVNPGQIDARNYANAYQYQRDLLWANYEDQGVDKGLAQESFLKSLPKYTGVTKGSVAF